MIKLFTAVLFIVSLSASVALSAEPPVFKNTDLEKYSSGKEAPAAEPATPPDSGRAEQQAENNRAKQYWCSTLTDADNRIKRAEENLVRANARRGEAWRSLNSGNRSTAVEADAGARQDLENAEEELVEAKREKERLQGEAHEQNIPAGWLRCQFE